MVVVVKDVVIGKMLHYLHGHHVFHTFAQNTCEGNRAVVGCPILLSLLENWDYICSLPVSRHFLLFFGGIIDEGYHQDHDIHELFKNSWLYVVYYGQQFCLGLTQRGVL